MQRLLITGASGLLGQNLLEAARSRFTISAWGHAHAGSIRGFEIVPCDLEDAVQIRKEITHARPEFIVHAAALSDVDYCETHPEQTKRINTEATRVLAQEAKRLGAFFVLISTDSVFDGQSGNYRENDVPRPLNQYAISKREAEVAVQMETPKHLIIRTNFFGWGPGHKLSLSEWMLTKLVKHQPLKLFTDVYITPLLANDLSQIILELAVKHSNGIYHVGSKDKCSKYEFGERLATVFKHPFKNVTPITLDQLPLTAPRPRNTSLNVGKASHALGRAMPTIEEGLQASLHLLEKGYAKKLRGESMDWLAGNPSQR
jgi:dTDP-4-dehydrorhamnose reductase